MAAVNLKPSSKGVLALVVAAVVIFVGCVLGYLGAAGKMKQTAVELAAKEKKVVESREIAQKLEKSKLDYQDTLSQIRFLETSVSTEAYVPTLLKQLEALGTSVNLKVVSVKPSRDKEKLASRKLTSGASAAQGNVEEASKTKRGASKQQVKEPPAPYDELKIVVEFEGKYTNVLDFLYKVTSFPKILAVKNVTITPKDSILLYSRAPKLVVDMTLTAFVLKGNDPAKLPGALPVVEPASVKPGASEGRATDES